MKPSTTPMRIAITGGSGFIGTNAVQHFLTQGAQVLNLDSQPPVNRVQGSVWRQADLLKPDDLARTLKVFAPTQLVHLAAVTHLHGRSLADYAANVSGLENLLEVISSLPELERVIFASSRMVCRIGYQPQDDTDYCPSTIYGESKVLGEKIVRERAERAAYSWVQVRPTSIWGPWFGVPYRNFFDAVQKRQYIHPKGRRIEKSFGFVGNTVHQISRLLQAQKPQIQGRTLYLCDYPPIEVRDWAERIRKELGVGKIREVPEELLRLAAGCGDLLQLLGMRNPPLTSFRLDNLLTTMIYNTRDLEAICGQLPWSLAGGVRETVAWMRNSSSAVAS